MGPNTGTILPAIAGATVSTPLAKGTNYLHLKRYLDEKVGVHAWPELLTKLEPADRVVLESVVSIGWYPSGLGTRLLHAADATFGKGDLTFVREVGRFSAEDDLNGIQRLFLRLLNPVLILEKSRDYWSRFHNTGQWTVERHGPQRATGSLAGWSVVDVAACAHIEAYVVRMYELVGSRRVRFEQTKCRARGDDVCSFSGEWR
jgi:hypothetical protein